jgi:ectoine hydroxylase-related dioxygenase (phytanoyl-CoA dioxygenase family)
MACTNPNLLDEEEQENFSLRFPQLSVSAMWAGSDFTAENGATRVVLRSHRQCPRTTMPTSDMQYAQAVMPQGSVLLWVGGTFHGAASAKPFDTSTERSPRHGLLFIYNLGLLRSEHNFFNAIPNDIIMGFDQELLDLLGYYGENAVEHPWYTGPVYTQPYLGGPQGASAGGDGVQFVISKDRLST